MNHEQLTGRIYFLNKEGEKVGGKMYDAGIFKGNMTPASKKLYQAFKNSRMRLEQDCFMVATDIYDHIIISDGNGHVYKDWYEYSHTEYDTYCGGGTGGYGGPSGGTGGGGTTGSDGAGNGDTEPSCENPDPIHGCFREDIDRVLTVPDAFENRIVMHDLDPCMADEMNQLTGVSTGVGEIIQDFAIDELDPDTDLRNLNWEVKDGILPKNVNRRTSTEYNQSTNTVTTIFDAEKFGNATDLSITRTILHEAVHAWVVSITFNNNLSVEDRNNLFGENWEHVFENQGHNFIASDYVTRIAGALEDFGNSKRYILSNQFYEDLAWGGLYNTPEFTNKSTQEQQRIRNLVHVGQYGTDTDGNFQSQKGGNGGC